MRVIETNANYIALCPYAPRVPYETWILPHFHESSFESIARLSPADARPLQVRDLAELLRGTLMRIQSVAEAFHLVLHTAPNHSQQTEQLGYWDTIEEDYHWHIEILPILTRKAKSYSLKEVYFSPVSPETAAARLRG